jgi:hypothetical protein
MLAERPKEALTIIYNFLGLPTVFSSLIPKETHTLSSRLTRRNRKILAKREPIGAQKDLCRLLVTLSHDFPWNSAVLAEKLGFTAQHRETLISLLAQDTRELGKFLTNSNSLWHHWNSIRWLTVPND